MRNDDVGTHGTCNGCRDARSERPLCQRYSIVVLTGTDAQTVRPYNGLHVLPFDNGRTDRQVPTAGYLLGWGRTHRRPASRPSSLYSGLLVGLPLECAIMHRPWWGLLFHSFFVTCHHFGGRGLTIALLGGMILVWVSHKYSLDSTK